MSESGESHFGSIAICPICKQVKQTYRTIYPKNGDHMRMMRHSHHAGLCPGSDEPPPPRGSGRIKETPSPQN